MRALIFALVALLTVIFLHLYTPPAHAATLPAAPSTFATVLSQAKGGDTIVAAPGVGYVLSMSGKSYNPPITITGPGAVFSSVNVFSSSGVNLNGFEVSSTCPEAGGHPNQINGSTSIRVENLLVHGNTACWSGLLVRSSSGVIVTRSEFYGTLVGLSRLDSSNLEISRNSFHDLQSDGTNGGCGDNILISGNYFTNFRPVKGDHPDAIQAWTTNCKAVSTGLTIADNVYVRGSGDLSTVAQGVFVNWDSPATDKRYAKVKIAGNVALGGMYNGVAVAGADGVEITGNIVAGFPDMESWIRWNDVTGAKLAGNKAQNYISEYMPNGGNSGAPSGNAIIPVVKDGGAAILASLTPMTVGPTVVASAPAPAPASDPRDAQITSLTAQVASLTAKVTTLTGQISTLQAQSASLAADIASARATVTDLTGKLSAASAANDNARAALAGVRDQATAALAK